MLISVAFLAVFLIFGAIILYTLLTKKGRMMGIKMTTGAEEVKEVMSLPTTQFSPKLGVKITQEIKLYECVDKNQKYYMLETTHKSIGSLNRYYTKLTDDSLKQLGTVLTSPIK